MPNAAAPEPSPHNLAAAPARSQGLAHLHALHAGHQRFLVGHSIHPHCSAQRLRNLVQGQHPIAAILSCADSRVPVELLFDAGFGDLFVVRNAGNTCTTASIASLEYAIEALDVSLLLVMGHEGCGAVTVACQPHGSLTPALHDLVGTIRQGLEEAAALNDLASAFRRNPIQSARHLVGGSELIRGRLNAGSLLLETACYTLRHGEIEWLGAMDASGALLPSHVEGASG